MPDTDDIQPDPPPPEPEEPYPDPPPPGSMPPANEPGLPATMPFGGEIGELFGGCSAAQSVFSLSTALRDGVMTSGMAMLGESGSQAQVGTQLVTSRGVVKADLISQGMLQLGFMGFQPLPLINCTSQLLFSPSGFLGGQLQSMLFLPIGMMVGSINTSTQWSLEMVTGAQPSESLGIMLGCHLWGDRMTAGGMRPAAARSNPGAIFGYKACLEITKHVIEDEESVASTAVCERSSTAAAHAHAHLHILATIFTRFPPLSLPLSTGNPRVHLTKSRCRRRTISLTRPYIKPLHL